MNWQNKGSAAILFGLILVASGCTGGNGEDTPNVDIEQTSGVTIEDFSAQPSNVVENQEFSLQLSLKNSGGQEARQVGARIFNLPIAGQERAFTSDSGSSNPTLSYGNLRPADSNTGTPALTRPDSVTLTAPNLNEGETIDYEAFARVAYLYDTIANTQITVMSQQRYRQSGQNRERPTVDNTGGPIQMEIRTRDPVVLRSGQQSTEICVIARNEGSGTPVPSNEYNGISGFSPDSSVDNRIDVTLDFSGTALQLAGGESASKTVRLNDGRGVKCWDANAGGVGSTQVQTTVPVTLTASYGYYQDTSASISVEGREG